MVDVVDEAAVRLVIEISPDFQRKINDAANRAGANIERQLKVSMKKVGKIIEDGLTKPMDRASRKVTASAKLAGKGIERGIGEGVRQSERRVGEAVVEINRLLERIRNRVDVIVTTRVNTKKANAEVEAFIAENDGRDISLDVKADTGALAKVKASLDDLLKRLSKKTSLVIDTRLGNVDTSNLTGGTVNIDVDADTAGAQAHIDGFIALNDGKSIDLDVDLDKDVDKKIVGSFDKIKDRLSGAFSGIGSLVSTTFKAVGDGLAKIGEAASKAFSAAIAAGGGFTKALASAGAAAAAAAPLLLAAIAAIALFAATCSAAIAALTSLAASIAYAAAAALPFAAALSSLGLAFAVVKIGSGGVADALKAQSAAQEELARTGEISVATQQKLDAAMKNLAPSARRFVGALIEVKSAFGGLRLDIQQRLFEGLARPLQNLGATYLPVLSGALGRVADLLNTAARGFLTWAQQPAVVMAVKDILDGLSRTLANILPAIGSVGKGLLTFFQGLIPGAERVGAGIRSWADSFADFANRVVSNGSFGKFINDAIDSAKSFGSLLADLGRLVGSVFSATKLSGDNIFDRIDKKVRDLTAFLNTPGGQAKLEGWAKRGEEFLSNLGEILSAVTAIIDVFVDLGNAINDAFDIGGNIKDLSGIIGVLDGDFKSLANGLGGQVGGAVDKMTLGLTNFADAGREVGDLRFDSFGNFAGSVADLEGKFVSAIPGADGLGKAIAGIGSVSEKNDKILSGSFGNAGKGLDALKAKIEGTNAFKDLVAETGRVPQEMSNVLARIGPLVNAKLVTPLEVARGKVAKNTSLTIKEFEKLPPGVQKVLKELGVNIVKPVSEATRKAQKAAQAGITLTQAEFAKLPKKVQEVLKNLGAVVEKSTKDGFAKGDAQAKKGVDTMAKTSGTLGDRIKEATKGAAKGFDTFLNSAKAAIQGATAGSEKLGANLDKAAKNRKTKFDVDDNAKEAKKRLDDAAKNRKTKIQVTVEGIAKKIGNFFSTLGNKIVGSLSFLPGLANGAIVDRETFARIGEAGREVVLPLAAKRINRTMELLRQSGLMDNPRVQQEVISRSIGSVNVSALHQTAPAARSTVTATAPSLPTRTAARASVATPQKVSYDNRVINQNFSVNNVWDTKQLASALYARMAGAGDR